MGAIRKLNRRWDAFSTALYDMAMLSNRSVPANTILSHLVYSDVAQAIAWLTKTFGFVEHYRYGDPNAPNGAQMHLGDAWIMLRSPRADSKTPKQAGVWTQSLTIFVDDVEAHYQKAKAAGANIVEELNQTPYGEFQYGVEDLDGHHWLFARHARDVSPEDWGATVATAFKPVS